MSKKYCSTKKLRLNGFKIISGSIGAMDEVPSTRAHAALRVPWQGLWGLRAVPRISASRHFRRRFRGFCSLRV